MGLFNRIVSWFYVKPCCKNPFFGEVKPDGYQYCKKCGKAILAPVKICQEHKWYILQTFHDTTITGFIVQTKYIHRCEICGDTKQEIYPELKYQF